MKLRKLQLIFLAALLLLLCACDAHVGPSGDLPPSSDEYDAILASGDSYHIVLKHIDEFNGAYDMLGVVDNKGSWIHPLADVHPLIKNNIVMTGTAPVIHVMGGGEADAATAESLRIRTVQNNITYLGEAMFALHYATNGNGVAQYMLYNAETNQGWEEELPSHTYFNDGYMICCADNKVYSKVKIISRDGRIIDPGLETGGGNVGPYEEGVFFSGISFYTIDGSLSIDLSAYKIVNTPYFADDKCYLEIENDGGSVYHTQIDHAGNFLYEPKMK